MTMTAEDYLREENEILRGQLETAKAGLDAAISKSRWQAVTNAELSAAQRELAAYKQATEEFYRDGSEAAFLILERTRELLAANA